MIQKTAAAFAAAGLQTAKKHRVIQERIAKADQKKSKTPQKPMQAGARKYPVPPLPSTTLKKPGKEKDLSLEPMYDAPYYKGSGKLKGKVAIITGGDSGIGKSVAILFAREGADIIIVYLSEHEDAKRTKKIIQKEGTQCVLLAGDVTDPSFCDFIVKQVVKKYSRIDVLVNNAAFQLHVNDLDDLTEEHFDLTMKTNLYGYFHMTKSAIPFMINGSSIINTGSVTGMMGSKGLPDYSLTKGGIHAWTRSLGSKLVGRGIRVNAVAPGPVWTPLNPADKEKKDVAKFGAKTPMKRPAQPEEIAPAYVFLASPQCSSYITGEILPIIGGYSGG